MSECLITTEKLGPLIRFRIRPVIIDHGSTAVCSQMYHKIITKECEVAG